MTSDDGQAQPYRRRSFPARWRLKLTTLGILILPLLAWRFGRPEMALWSWGPGAGLTFSGVGLRLWAAGWLHKDRELASGGPYLLARHPLYLGTGIIALGHGLMSAVAFAPLSFFGLWLLLYLPVMMEEEAFLEERFGSSYELYRKHAGLLWPKLSWGNRDSPPSFDAAARCFSWAQAWRNREYEAALINTLLVAFYFWIRRH